MAAQAFLLCLIKIKFFICQDYQNNCLLFSRTKGNTVSSTVNKRNIFMSQTCFSTCTHPLRTLTLNHSETNSVSLCWMFISLEKQFSLVHLQNLAQLRLLRCFSFLSSLWMSWLAFSYCEPDPNPTVVHGKAHLGQPCGQRELEEE